MQFLSNITKLKCSILFRSFHSVFLQIDNHRREVILKSCWQLWINKNMSVFIFSSFSFFEKIYLLLSCTTSVRPSVRPSVEIIYFRGNSLSNWPIELKIGLTVREGVVHVQKA